MKRLSLLAAALLLPACAGGAGSLPTAALSHGRAAATVLAPGGSNLACRNGGPTSSGDVTMSGTVPSGDALWINVAGQFGNVSTTTNVVFHDVYYTMTLADGSTVSKRMPDAQITVGGGSGAGGAFWAMNMWNVTLPVAHKWNAFMDGFVVLEPSDYQPVSASISGTLCSDQPGVTVAWSFGAAVYNDLFYAPAFAWPKLEDKSLGPPSPAGTPQLMLWNFVGGAGTGGSGFTGALGPAVNVTL